MVVLIVFLNTFNFLKIYEKLRNSQKPLSDYSKPTFKVSSLIQSTVLREQNPQYIVESLSDLESTFTTSLLDYVARVSLSSL